ncbi:hypothetical protein MKW94_030039 [Papaver nudicaule]|uniref:Methyltransferase family protein n=1 Tax=Papaver nudicaule TaxID=74823 RepID=A0AA41VJI3_PAPNU|nr:hypothetical protein [Papaver nudicaule]
MSSEIKREKLQAHQTMEKEEEEDDIVCLDASFFMNDNYELTTFTFGSLELKLLCLQSASTDYDLTGQMVWPGCVLLNNYLSQNPHVVQGCSVIELGSGVGVTGILCSRFCREVLLTDHNDEVVKIMKKNIELNTSSGTPDCCAGLAAEKLEWGNTDQISQILQRYPKGFDLVLGADIYILTFTLKISDAFPLFSLNVYLSVFLNNIYAFNNLASHHFSTRWKSYFNFEERTTANSF